MNDRKMCKIADIVKQNKNFQRFQFSHPYIMSLAPAIEFRWLAAQLTDTEKNTFVTNLTASNPHLIMRALAALFINKSKHQKPTETINVQCNQTISNIIQSRDSDDVDVEAVKLDSMPRRLIGHCASFLDQKSYSNISLCNRTVYLGCNTPSKLKEVCVGYKLPRNNLPVDLSRFPFATNLKIIDVWDPEAEYYFFVEDIESLVDELRIARQIAKMTRVQSLDLSEVDFHTRFLGIITRHETTTLRTKALSVETDYEGDNDEFIANITAFKHLEFLKVNINEDSVAEWDIKSIIYMCRNLKGLDFDDIGHGIEVKILQEIGHRLHYLKLNRANTVKGIDFAELRQFKQGTECDEDVMRMLLRTAINLEKVKMDGDATLIGELLENCKRLRYLEIDAKDIALVLNALEKALPHAQFSHNKAIKIRVNASSSCASFLRNSKCIKTLQRITESLSLNMDNQWMLILHIKHSTKSFTNDLCESLQSENLNIAVSQDSSNHIILMTNRDCSICGWRESWLMNL